MRYAEALTRTLDFSRTKDSVDQQFRKLWPMVYDGALAESIRQGGPSPTPAHIKVAGFLFESWYRSVYYRKDRYGGTLIVHRSEDVLYWLRLLCSQFLGLRDVEHQQWDASSLCMMMRADKDAKILGVRSVLFYGLPFDGIMSWDLSNMLSACAAEESLFFATTPLGQWNVKATGDGSLLDLSQRVEIVNVAAIMLRARNA